MTDKSLIDAPYFERNRSQDMLDGNLSIHFWQFDAMYEEFWKTLTFEKAKMLLEIIISNGSSAPLSIEKLIYRSDYYCQKWQELKAKWKKKDE